MGKRGQREKGDRDVPGDGSLQPVVPILPFNKGISQPVEQNCEAAGYLESESEIIS